MRQLKKNALGLSKSKYTSNGKLRKVFLTCSKCGRSVHIRTNDKKMYTKEVRKNFICSLCKMKEKQNNGDI